MGMSQDYLDAASNNASFVKLEQIFGKEIKLFLFCFFVY